MTRIRRSDIVEVISGKDKGKTGKVLRVFLEEQKAIVEGANIIKKHSRRTQENPKGAIIEKESPIHLSNLMLFCKNCNSAVRAKVNISADKAKSRLCINCNNQI